ncbi:uncharacterized protein MONOS_12646 [Monocercomonoides exilis]|uniref:uncharacterized protein n=1 Tax=Monocercomonoides exilis TaxID=2049356 RepID=UPI00355A3667|nr:hypothetical protein MONOS_12646 [Monocercomonoides exilis]|eukprot:MONOS_12646.1-p1 / transcript=MONOS_12646.1 / gene=MONOS_12646 / organism=Monocercomonoides_exilis_PA203 / gene_product=unspecified product / transcript_product=unspecified product / location=Mono_scaffold00714:92-11404(-) / protein_length=3701 / sequence_SO=supercontig / SO=protein_coding / is_pseudo=false
MIQKCKCVPLDATIEDAFSKERVKEKEKIPACEYSFDHGEFEMKTFDTKNEEMYCSLKNGYSEGADERKEVLMKNKENKAKVKSNDHFDEKCEDCANTENLKVSGKGNEFFRSEMKGCVVLKNSSVLLRGLRMGCGDGKGIACAWSESEIAMDGCGVIVESGISPLDLKGSCATLVNISLKTSKTQFPQIPPLFASNPTEDRLQCFGRVSICSSRFSSMTLSSAPFLSSPSIESAALSRMVFFNISSSSSSRGSVSISCWESCTLIDGCLFSSVCDVYDGGIAQSINSQLSSLSASNTSFVGCCRTRNVEFLGSEDNKKSPGRQNLTDNGANTFTWCEWNGSRTTGTTYSFTDSASNGGAIFMCSRPMGMLSVKFCSFNVCLAHYTGGGITCNSIDSIEIVNSKFNGCVATNYAGGGMYVNSILSCVRISDCEFQRCKAIGSGGGLSISSFNVSESGCIDSESGKGESSCVFECSFTSCVLSSSSGGGMNCQSVPAAFKMRSLQFISCNAISIGGGLYFDSNQQMAPSNNLYCFFFFFHDCRCASSNSYGHDMYFQDFYNIFSSANPFYESYTTNTNDKRVYRQYYDGSSVVYQFTEKKWWLKEGMKDRFVGVGGSDTNNLCGMAESAPCKTVGHAVGASLTQLSSTITVLGGKHVNEGTVISVGEKKISIVGKGKEVSVIGTSALSTSSATLFSVTSGQLEMEHVGIDHNSIRSSSPNVFVVSVGSGTLSLEDVLISSSMSGGSVISASVFEVALRQLKMVDVEIENMKITQPLFAEPSSAGSPSGESLLGNVTIRNVNRTGGDGVAMAKNVKAGETFVVWNTTIEGCECLGGNGGGIKVELVSSTSKVRIGDSTSHSGGTTTFNQCKSSGYGGGVMLFLADGSFNFEISSVSFVGCSATLGGKDVFVNGSRFVSGTITTAKLNFSRNVSIYDELMGYDRNEIGMGRFPLNVFFDTFSGAAHVGKEVNGCGGYDSWFCGFRYFPCSTIAFAAQNRFSSSKKNIVLDPGFELGEVVSMAGSYEWEVYCATNKTNVNVWLPSGMTSSSLINVQSASSIKNIAFQIPFSLSSATSLICLTSSSLTLTGCSVAHLSEGTSSVSFGYSFVNVQSGSLKMDRFVMEEGLALVFGAHSAIEFCEGMASVICSGCNISGVKRNEGDGGWMKGTVGSSGTLTVDGCNVNGCGCVGGKGGGMHIRLKGNGKVVVNGSSVIDGNKAENNGGRGGRGGGMFVLMENGGCGLTIGQNVEFSKVNGNVATYGKDVFVDCGSGVLLESKVNSNTFSFFDTSIIPSDVLKLSGSENGDENGVIPLFVYLCSMGTKVIVDGSGGNGKDHNHCGFEKFGCLTVDYCANSRLSESSKEIEIVSSSSIAKEITVPSFGVLISGRIVSSDGERMGVNVSDGGSATQDWLVGCSSSLTMSRLSFVVKGQMNPRRSAFIHSTSTLSVTNCSVSFESGALIDGKIGYSIIDMAGGNLIVDGFVMESGVTLTMNGKSPISITSGAQLEILNSRVRGVEITGVDGGCLNVEIKEGGSVKIEGCNFSSTCSGGSGMKGGGMMISVGKGGSLEMKNVNLSECKVLSSEAVNGGRGLGGGMFAELADQMGRFSLESMAFCECNAWKGKNLFVEAQDLSAVINSTSIGFNPEIRINLTDFNELCGRERNNLELIVPLVVFLRTFSSPAYVSGREQGSEFKLCGYEDYPCRTIGEASEYRYPSSKRNIRLTNTFSFDEEVQLNKQSYEIDSSNKDVGLKVGGTGTKTQEALVMNSVSSTLTGILFELGESIWEHTSFVHSSGGTLRFADCGIKMGNGVDAVNFVFVSGSGGKVEIIRMICGGSVGEVRFVGSVIVVNGNCECMMDEVIINQTISNGVNGLIEIAASSSATIQNCSIANCDLPSCGVIQVGKYSSITLKNTSFENITRGKGDGGCLCLRSNGDGSKDTMKIENCTFRMCKVNENGKGGGGLSVSLENPSELYALSTRFEKCCAPSTSGSEGKGGGIFLSLADADARFELSGDLIFDGNEAEYGMNVFIESGDLERSVTGEHIKFVIALSDLSVEAMGMDGKWRDVVIPLKFYLAEKLNRIKMGDEGKDVVVCGFDELRCKTVGYGARRLEGQERYLEFGERYEMKEIVELDGVEGYHFCGVLTKTNMEMVGNGFGGDWMMDVSTSSATFERICFVVLCSQPSSVALAQTKIFCVSGTNGTLIIERCSVESKTREGECSCSFACVRSGRLSIFDFSMNHAKFGLNPFVVVDINGEGSIENALFESVETTNMKGLIEYSSSSSSLSFVNVTAQECVMGGKGLILDDNGKKLRMRNCMIMKTCSLEGNGSVVSGEVGDGCAVEVNDVAIEECGTLKGCGGGMAVILKGTGEMRLGKSGVVTSFEKCSAGNEGSVGGYGGGVLLRCEEGGSDFMMSELAFGTGEGANTAAYGGNNMFIEGTYLPQLVNSASFNFSFEIEGDGFNIKDLMGAEDGNEMRLIPIVVFFREKPRVGFVNGGNGGMDYHKCGYADFACSTLTYAGTSVFDTSPTTLKLVDGSSIFDELTLNTQEMNIDGDVAKAKIGISEGGENEFLIKSERAISFSSLAFSISTFAESRKEYVFLCSSSTLRFEGCSFGAESQEIGVGLICGKGGKVELVRCEFGDFAMTKSGMVTFDGAGVEGLIDEVIVRKVTRENEGRSLFELRNGDVEIKNTTMNESSFENGNEIEIGEGINTKIWNCTFKSIQRENGNGGVLNGRVGSGKCVDINKCVFEECKCNSVSAIGGGIVMIVGDGGKLLFDDNKMNGCTVSDRSGKGGGMHLTFETTNIEYSMKNDDFANNVAEKGEDVYLACGSPWTMLLPAFWEGTATRVTAENKMWVLESSEQRKEDSLINYLFPRLGTNLFVSNAGNELSSCGVKENPCSSVDIGFDQLNDEIERIVLVGAASVSKTINRKVKGLIIEGNEETRELVVKEGGKFELTEGDGQTHLALSLLQISLPCFSSASATGDGSIVEVRIGQCFILDCLFSKGEGNSIVNECGKWIVIGNGGVIQIERTEMNGIRFDGCGIARFGGGNVIFENCSLDGIETSGGGVIVGNGGSEITLRNMTGLGCVVGAGSLITSNGGSSLRVDGESRFENIQTESVSGGCLKSEMKLNDLLEIESSFILTCSANGNGGRGGGIYMGLSDNCVNNFALTTLTFEDNVAAEGRDLFIWCKKLNETVTKERFGFEYEYENGEGEGKGMAVDMKGIDRDYFAESVDLGLFLVEMKRMEVCVSREGYDTLGCGSDGHPCESMWSGISHIDRRGTEGERKVKVRDKGTIEDIYSFTDALVIEGCVNEGEAIKHKPVHFEGTINGDSSSTSSVISSTVSLILLSLMLQIPCQFEPNMNSLISSNGVLQFKDCLFEIQSSSDIIQYSLITTTSGSCTLKGCSLADCSFVKFPLMMASSVLFENSNFSNIVNTGSGEEGGVARVILKNEEDLVIKSTNASSCSLSSNNGKGGFLYLDCQNCLNKNPFIFDVGVTFENNKAAIGKNLFILGKDFNSSVTNDSFKFDYSSMINDKNLFAGSDDFHQEKDLFMFLIQYSSFEIFISSNGFDVARCGSEEEPCFTMWKGMENMKKENGNKTTQITGSTVIQNSFNVSNYQIKKSALMGEENVKAILNFEKAIGSQLEYFMVNNDHLELTNIQLQLTLGFDNSAKTIISNKEGALVITGCSLYSEAGVNNGFD